MSKPPFSRQKAIKAVNTSQMIEGYKRTTIERVKAEVKRVLASK
jgi:hypothetical protein